MNLITTTALVVLMAITATNADEWNWLNNGEAFMEDLIREKRQDGSQNVTEVGDDDIINYILDSGRQGRSLEGFDEIYTDPSVMQAIQNSDDVEARNIIKEKLCALGLMQCDGELVDGRRPYLNPQNLIYAQPVALKPVGRPIATIPIRGPPGPPSQGPQYVPRPPQQKPHQGPYGPPQPMPPPNRPQQKVGFSSQQPPYGGPNSFSGSSSFSGSYSGQSGSFSSYPSKPLGPIYEGGDIPYEFETPNKPPGVIVGDGPAIVKAPVEQHIHHHYHHIEGGKDEKTIVVNNPIPLSPGVITGSAVGGSLSTSNSLYSSNAAYGNSGSGSFSSGGFNPVGGKDFDYQELKGSAGSINSNNNGYGQQFGSYASQSKPTGGSNNYYNQGPATFGSSENTVYGSYAVDNAGSGSSSNNKYNGLSSSNYQSSQGAFHASNPNLYKKELNVKGPANGLNSYSGDYSKYSQQSNGQYSQQSNGQFNQNLYSINNGQYNNGNQGQYNGNNAFSNRNEDCVCVPYDQCPAQDVVGRRDDLILPLDPRNLKTDIQADTEQVVITDSKGVMTIVQAPKNLTAESRSANVTEPAKKITKREASPASKKVDSEDDKAKIEPNIPTPAPGHSEGSNIVSFPRSRRSTDVPAPDQLEPVKEITDSLAVPSEQIEVQEKSISAEKRQAYYGARPQQCQARQVCCRRQVYRPPQPPTHANLGKCGVRNAQGINGRIKNPVYVDGDSEFGEYPWQVAILKKDPKESVYVCGGTLIDNQYIITAAHCVKTYNGFDLRVRLGEWDVNHDVEFYPYIERDVISVQVHPEYYAGTLDNDLAILKMDRPADFSNTPHISPACLPDKFTDFSGQRCWTTGWGKDAFGDYGKYQNILKEVDVPIINHQQCQNQLRQTRLGYSYTLNPGFLCAGGEEGKDACKGDGGGPLVCERNGSWQVVGIVSWGIGCGKANVPGVYVKVAHYLDWINQVRGRY